jgi:DNA repair protein RecO (recombination protein O)
MLLTTRGIVFNQVRYGETSIIAKIYTEHSGLQSYLVKGARSRHARIRTAHLQHLTLVELEVNQRSNKELQYLKSLKIEHPFRDIPFNIRKSAVAVFLNEVLYKVIREEEPNNDLFGFLYNAIHFLDLQSESPVLFHHLFLIRLSRYLGFYPRDNFSDQQPYFNLQEGEFTASPGPGGTITGPPASKLLHDLMPLNFEDIDRLGISGKDRQELLEMLLSYYRLHVPGFATLKSHLVLAEVFSQK